MAEAIWSSHAGLSENRQYEKLCCRTEDFHGLLWPRLSGPAMLVYMQLVSAERSVAALDSDKKIISDWTLTSRWR
ncbi:MAG: hypothetical protein ACK5PS_16865 [Desulfopila sp.]